jgi:hypothetical protein
MVDLLWAKLSDWGVAVAVVGVAFSVVTSALLDRSSLAVLARTVIIRRQLVRLNVAFRPKAKDLAISLTYLNHIKRGNALTKIALAIAAASSALAHVRYPDLSLLPIALVSTTVLALVLLKEILVEYRVRHGYFGTTRAEARDLIAFIVANAKDIDFHDDSGTLRNALIPEKEKPASSNTELVPGQVAL